MFLSLAALFVLLGIYYFIPSMSFYVEHELMWVGILLFSLVVGGGVLMLILAFPWIHAGLGAQKRVIEIVKNHGRITVEDLIAQTGMDRKDLVPMLKGTQQVGKGIAFDEKAGEVTYVGPPPRGAKKPLLAAVLSFLLPGLGHFYLGRKMRGLLWLIVAILLFCVFASILPTMAVTIGVVLAVLSALDALKIAKT
jgi:TM2 domain-containing membrane protein YozV